MHVTERENKILSLLRETGFISFRALEEKIDGAPATIRRDLERLDKQGKLVRVRGGAKSVDAPTNATSSRPVQFQGSPFEKNIKLNMAQKVAIGRKAAALCKDGEGIMIDGGSTTLQMCPSLGGRNMQILTNSLHIVRGLVGERNTSVLVPGGTVFAEQNIILPMFGEDLTPAFHAPKLFMGAASIGPEGLMQEDVILVASERRLIERAEEVIVLADSSKFEQSSGNVVCPLTDINVLITDSGISQKTTEILTAAGITLILAD